jgi:hypothetical protein
MTADNGTVFGQIAKSTTTAKLLLARSFVASANTAVGTPCKNSKLDI